MRKLLTFLWVLVSTAAYAQTQTIVTGTIQRPNGQLATSGYVEFNISPSSQAVIYYVMGTAIIAPQSGRCGINSSGQIKDSALTGDCLVWANTVLTPSNTTYSITIAPNNSPSTKIKQVNIFGTSYNLNNPVFAPVVNIVPQYQTITTQPIAVNLVPVAPHVFTVGNAGYPYAAGYFDTVFVNGSPISGGGGTLVGTGSANQLARWTSTTNTLDGITLPTCGDATHALSSTGTTFGCQAISAGGTGTVTSITFNAPFTGGTITSSGTVGLPVATSSSNGYLSSVDWTTFNSKISAAVTSITVTTPLTGGTITSTGTIGCQTATGAQAGCLSAADWTTFNSKGNGTVTGSGLTLGRLIIGNSGVGITVGDLAGDVTTSGSTTSTVGKVNGVTYPSGPSTNTVPVVTASNTVTYKAVPNCGDSSHALAYNTGTFTWSCQSISAAGGNVTGSSLTSGQLITGASGSAIQVGNLSGDVTTSGSTTTTVTKVNGVTYASSPSTNTTPIITSSNVATYTAIPNCGDATHALAYDTTAHTYSCQAITGTGGTGDVVGPGSATDNGIVRFDTGTGKLVQNTSGPLLSDAGRITNLVDPTSAQDAATKAYVDAQIIAAGGGDVVGPAGATNLDVAIFDGTTGKVIKDSAIASANLVTAASTLTSGQLMTGAGSKASQVGNLSGDVTTSGSTTSTVVKVNGVSYAASPSTDTTPVVTAANTATYTSITNCGDSTHALAYSTSTHLFSCQAITGTAAAGGSNTQLQYNNSGALGGVAGVTTNGTAVTFASSDFILAGSSSGTTVVNAAATASGTLTLPAATDTLVARATTDTLSNKTLGNSNVVTLRTDRFTVQDSSDTTKQGVFSLAANTTATTRTYTFPNVDTVVTGTNATQTLTNKTFDNSNIFAVRDDRFTLQDSADATKQAVFELSGITTGTTRTYTVPNASTTLVGTGATLTSGQLLVGAGTSIVGVGNLSGDVTTSGSAVTTVAKVNGVTYGSGPSTNTVPVVTASNTVTYKAVPNCGSFRTALAYDTGTSTFSCQTVGFPLVTTTASSATPTPNADTTDLYVLTALAANATFGAPTGTPVQGQRLLIRVKDNGTPRTLAFNSIYRASSSLALPTSTTTSKTQYIQFIYNSTDTKWDFVAWLDNF